MGSAEADTDGSDEAVGTWKEFGDESKAPVAAGYVGLLDEDEISDLDGRFSELVLLPVVASSAEFCEKSVAEFGPEGVGGSTRFFEALDELCVEPIFAGNDEVLVVGVAILVDGRVQRLLLFLFSQEWMENVEGTDQGKIGVAVGDVGEGTAVNCPFSFC